MIIHIAIDCHSLASRLKSIYGSRDGQTRVQSLLRAFTPMFILVCAALVSKLLG